MRSLSSSMAILVATLVLWAIPARGQIVSYMDDDGKRVFVNAETAAPPPKPSKMPLLRTSATGLTPRTQLTFAASPEFPPLSWPIGRRSSR